MATSRTTAKSSIGSAKSSSQPKIHVQAGPSGGGQQGGKSPASPSAESLQDRLDASANRDQALSEEQTANKDGLANGSTYVTGSAAQEDAKSNVGEDEEGFEVGRSVTRFSGDSKSSHMVDDIIQEGRDRGAHMEVIENDPFASNLIDQMREQLMAEKGDGSKLDKNSDYDPLKQQKGQDPIEDASQPSRDVLAGLMEAAANGQFQQPPPEQQKLPEPQAPMEQ